MSDHSLWGVVLKAWHPTENSTGAHPGVHEEEWASNREVGEVACVRTLRERWGAESSAQRTRNGLTPKVRSKLAPPYNTDCLNEQ